jgi:spore photoproduct lyase
MSIIKYQKTKTIACKENGRSSDFTSANFILGCVLKNSNEYNSPCSYCYVARFGRKFIYVNTNTDEILEQCDKAIQKLPFPKIPNQVDNTFYYVDISCDTDINNHWNLYDWFYVFDFFKNHEKLAATFATKWVNTKLLDYEPNNKIRVRMSLMPESNRIILEKNTSPIINRIKFLQKLFEKGYSTHINFSPIIYKENWLQEYKELFNIINNEISEEFKKQCGLECIFLTHNENLHKINLNKNMIEQENLLWNPSLQEIKHSQYGGVNLRYERIFKATLVEEFKSLVASDLNINIRYIF